MSYPNKPNQSHVHFLARLLAFLLIILLGANEPHKSLKFLIFLVFSVLFIRVGPVGRMC